MTQPQIPLLPISFQLPIWPQLPSLNSFNKSMQQMQHIFQKLEADPEEFRLNYLKARRKSLEEETHRIETRLLNIKKTAFIVVLFGISLSFIVTWWIGIASVAFVATLLPVFIKLWHVWRKHVKHQINEVDTEILMLS